MQKQWFVLVVWCVLSCSALGCSSKSSGAESAGTTTRVTDAGPSQSGVLQDAGAAASQPRARRDEDDAGTPAPAADSGKSSATVAFEKLAGAYCDKLAQCASFGFERSYESGDECRKRRMQLYAFWSELPDTGWTDEAREACYESVYGLSCREFIDDNGQKACAPKGKRQDGESCNAREQCASRFCDGQGYGCGTCKKAPEEGASCKQDNDCPDESACLCDNGTPRCQSPRCRRLRDAEEACSAEQPCGSGLNCVDGRCALAPSQKGASCDPRAGLRCDTVSAGLVCTPDGCAQLKAADVCSPTEYCKDRGTSCELGTDNATPACVAVPGDNGDCDPAKGRSCRFPALCVAGKCQAPGAAALCAPKK
jgi:hypothetical protein